MSKYIIELDDRIKLVTSIGVTENGVVYTTSDYVHNLEELNSDYINENFGSLQDEAYQRGLEDGKWKAEDGCDGCKYYGDTSLTNPCSECSRGCVDHYKPASDPDRIEVGDIVERYIDGKLDSKGIFLQEDSGYWRCLFDTGAVLMTFAYPKGQFKKTGKHYDIQSILEAMRTHDQGSSTQQTQPAIHREARFLERLPLRPPIPRLETPIRRSNGTDAQSSRL